jgi:type II restriction/modification system DNA methylase subunit YeeA
MSYDGDAYRLAKEYAAEEFDPWSEMYWVVVGAYIKGYDTGVKGLEKITNGVKITRITFFFSAVPRSFELKHPVMVADRFTFLHQLRHITGIKEVSVYE